METIDAYGFVDATAHIPDAIARLPPCSSLLDVFYTFDGCFFQQKTNEDTQVVIVEYNVAEQGNGYQR